MQQQRVLLVRSESCGWDSLRKALGSAPRAHVVGDVTTADQALRLAAVHKPSVVFAGDTIGDQSSLSLLSDLRVVLGPNSAIVVIADDFDLEWLLDLERVHLAGYLLWGDLSTVMLPHYLAVALAGKVVMGNCTLSKAYVNMRRTPEGILADIEKVTPREIRVLKSRIVGMPVKVIAKVERVHEHTIRRDIESLRDKLDVQSEIGLGVAAHKLGLVLQLQLHSEPRQSTLVVTTSGTGLMPPAPG